MKDANGRPVEVGDWVATPWPRLADMDHVTAEIIVALPAIIKGAILGKVIKFGEGEFVYLEGYDDGIVYSPDEFVTLGGFEFITCPECGQSWPFDVRMNVEEECPFCDTVVRNPKPVVDSIDDEEACLDQTIDDMEWDAEMALHGGQLADW